MKTCFLLIPIVAIATLSASPITHLTYKFYHGSWDMMPDFSKMEPKKTGMLAHGLFDISPRDRMDGFGFVFTGEIDCPKNGNYNFTLSSDDGSLLFIDGKIVVSNDGIHGNRTRSGEAKLKAGKHGIEVRFFEKGGGEELFVGWSGPGIKNQSLSRGAKAPILAQEQPIRIPAGYSVEKIETPEGVSLGVGGMEFASDGSLMLCTREGEVWKYVIQEKQWSLFADGLHESLGLWIDPKTSETFVIQRGEITKLIDSNEDGRADLYESFNAGWGVTDNYHEYAFGLVRDSKGNFYGTLNTSLSWPGWARSDKWDVARVHDGKMGRAAKYRGWCFKVTPDGQFEPYAAGLRSPAGIGISKDDELFFTDNQGDWEASSSLHHIVKGRFHGHPSSLWDHPDYKGKDLNAISIEDYEKAWSRPAVWIPHGELANSPGEPIFDYTGGKFGPFADQMFIGDQSRSNLMRVVLEKVGGEYQGVIFDFVNRLQTGCIRHVFAGDGSLWVGQTGRGWGSAGKKEFGLQRVVWDGKTQPFSMHAVNLTKTGFRITFTKPVDLALANEANSYLVERWGYHYHPHYGSGKTDHKKEAPTKVTVAKDGLSVHLEVPLETKRVYKLILNGIKGKDGDAMANNVAWYTLNRLQD